MKKFLAILFTMLMSISISAFAGTTTSKVKNHKSEKVSVPANIIIKQEVTFTDGKTIELFYKKTGNDCKVYSTENLNKYGLSDLMRIKSTNFERVDHVEGKCYASKTVSALVAMARKALR